MTKAAVLGLGAMGARMAQRLVDAGHEMTVWNRTPERVLPFLKLGARTAESPAMAARDADVVITMVSDPAALRDVTEGPNGVASGIGDETTMIDMSTVGPAAVSRLASILPADVGLLDAPVLGSRSEAEAGTLRIFVGGGERLADAWMPFLAALGSPMRVGPSGAGASAKLVANLTLFGTLGLLGEALALAHGLGLANDTAFEVLAVTPLGAQAERRRTTIERGTYEPRFPISLARKDADLIAEAAAAAETDVRIAEAARTWLLDAEGSGRGGDDYASLLATILG
jgi:3-hydroxyisobutyrate dehydrogenase-like beta-hydroxyacid dehydrogenase